MYVILLSMHNSIIDHTPNVDVGRVGALGGVGAQGRGGSIGRGGGALGDPSQIPNTPHLPILMLYQPNKVALM